MKTWLKWMAALAGLVAAVALIRVLPVGEHLERFGETTRELGWIGPVVFGAVYVVGALTLIPGSLLSLIAGAVFGVLVGTITVIISASIGAALAFLIARYLLRARVARFAVKNRHFDAIDRAIAQGGWRIVALLRLSPAVPFTIANYLFGLTSVRFGPYVASSFLAMLPGTVLYVYLGHAGREGATSTGRSPAEWALLAVGLFATIAVTLYVSRLARRALAETAVAETMPADVPADGESRSA